MSGSVYQRDDGKWVGAVSMGKDEFGKRVRKVVYGNTKRETEDKLNTLVFEIKTGEYQEEAKDTLIDFLKEYHKICAGYDMWDSKNTKPKDAKWESTTSELYKMYIDVHFEPYFLLMKLKDVKPITLDKFYNYKMSAERKIECKNNSVMVKKTIKPLSPNTVIKLNKFLKAAFNYAVVNKKIKDNPTNQVILVKKKDYKPNIYVEDQFLTLIDHVAGTDDEIPIILGGGCGLRRGEIFGLHWGNIDFTNKTITIEKTNVRFKNYTEKDPKNETSKRTMAVPDYVISILRLYKIRSKHTGPDDKLIPRWKPNVYSERFKKLLVKFHLPITRLHDLRHYNATIMMYYNIPDKVAAQRLGHANTTMLKKTYQHVLEGMDKKAASGINNMFEKKNSQQAAT